MSTIEENRINIKNRLHSIKETLKPLQEIEETYLLADLFYDIQSLIEKYSMKEIKFSINEYEKKKNFLNGLYIEYSIYDKIRKDPLILVLRMAFGEARDTTYVKQYERILQLTNGVTFRNIDASSTIEEFFRNFDKDYNAIYLSTLLQEKVVDKKVIQSRAKI